ncbi:MAG: M23 family metallopeptidase [Patescibacteria group bacterium]
MPLATESLKKSVSIQPSVVSSNALHQIKEILSAIGRTAILAAKVAIPAVGISACAEPSDDMPPEPPAISDGAYALTINDLHPPPASLVLPLQNGVRTRVSQRANGDFSHRADSTRHAVDFAIDGLAIAPVSGTVRLRDGGCHNTLCGLENNGCASGWGNAVELESRDGQTYLFAHCKKFSDEIIGRDGAFMLRGTPICEIGCTGVSTGPHLHFDSVTRNRGGGYTSRGVNNYTTMVEGEAEPSIETPATLEPCCHSCTVQPNTPSCKTYASFNRSLKDTLTLFADELQRTDPRVVQLDGDPIQSPDRSDAVKTVAYQPVITLFDGQRSRGWALFYHKSPGADGQRNPFIDTAYSFIWNPFTVQWEDGRWHTQVHTPRFINFDLWDFANSSLSQQERDGLEDGNLPFTQNVQTYDMQQYDDWADWELYGTQFNLNGEQIGAYLAVYHPMRGGRYAKLFRNGQWSEWTLM